MNGSPAKLGTINGTAGHGSALKMKTASALKAKAKNPKAKTYKEAYSDYVTGGGYNRDGGKYKTEAEFTTAAKAWNTKTYGTKNPTRDANKAGMTKKEYAAKYKASKTTKVVPKTTTKVVPKTTTTTKVVPKTEKNTKTTVATKGKNKGQTVVKGLGAKKSKTLTVTEKAAEKTLRGGLKTEIKIDKYYNKKIEDKKYKNNKNYKNKRDKDQLALGESRAGKNNAKTGTVVSRYLGRLKVKRNKRQLEKRKRKGNA